MDIYKQLHANDGVVISKRVKRSVDESVNLWTTENNKIIDESDNIITFTAKG